MATQQKRRFRFKNPLFSIDSSTIDLCLSMYDWAKFRRTKGAVKLHLMLNHQGYLPHWALITDGKVHDVTVAKTLDFEPGTIVVMDRGYIDYDLFDYWTGEGVWFVTRAKKNMAYRVVKQRDRFPVAAMSCVMKKSSLPAMMPAASVRTGCVGLWSGMKSNAA